MAVFQISGIDFLVDEEDLNLLSTKKWRISTNGRPICTIKENGKKKTVLIHRFINKTKNGYFTDHINGDYKDNRKCNLRDSTPQQNQWNRKCGKLSATGIKGVGFCKQTKKWRVSIFMDGKRKTIGRFDCLGTAIKTYNSTALSYHGEFARLNKRSA
jgi:hypothetical protein